MAVTIVLFDSSLELTGSELAKHPIIVRDAKRRRKNPFNILLDRNIHYGAFIQTGRDVKNRGRPDLIHTCLLSILSLPIHKNGELRLWVHTKNDLTFYCPPFWRVPVHLLRFKGILEDLFVKKRIMLKNCDDLVIKNHSLEGLLNELHPSEIILLSSKGEKWSWNKFGNYIKSLESPVVLIGGFPWGEPRDEIKVMANHSVCLEQEPLPAWCVASGVAFSLMF